MKKSILLLVLPLLVFSLLTLTAYSATALQQDKPATADDITMLKKTISSLQGQLAKQRTVMMKQNQQNEDNISKLKAADTKQQSAIADLKTSLSSQQEELSKVPEAIATRSYIFGQKRILAVSLIIIALLLVLIYVLSLRRKVDAFNANLKIVEDNLRQQLMQAHAENKDYLVKQTADLKAMLERQTTENKNRIVALLADANALVHKMGDEVNRATDAKVAALKHELGTGIAQLNERLSKMDSNKSL